MIITDMVGNDQPKEITVYFAVSAPNVRSGEYVFVTGSTPELGEWRASDALQLTLDEEKSAWTGNVSAGPGIIKFRYFSGYYLKSDNNAEPSLVISKWETFLSPRCLMPAVEEKDGVCKPNHCDEFGHYAGKCMLSGGWILTQSQSEILLRIHGSALRFYKNRHIQKCYRLKVAPLDLRQKQELVADDDFEDVADEHTDPGMPSYSSTDIAALSHDDPAYHDQDEDGNLFENGNDYFIYRTQSVAVEYLGFRIEVYGERDGKWEMIGMAYAMPSSFPGDFGKAALPILKKNGLPVGKIDVDYLFIHPLKIPHPDQLTNVSYRKHWKKRSTLEVGHRGMGNSYTKFAAARENTLYSLDAAAKKGADYVEFDVQLTKDRVAVVFHDFHVLVSVAKRTPSLLNLTCDADKRQIVDMHEMAIKDLKYDQLRLLHLDHVGHHDIDHKMTKVTGEINEADEFRPFPRLSEALMKVDPDVGFNIEVKYPMMQKDGLHECENYFGRNEVIDVILSDVLNHAGNRRIVFSSFDPDICTMISLKQNKYPVLFLCVGDTTRYVPFLDQRSSTSLTAVNFAAGTELLGVNFHSEDLLRTRVPVDKANQFGLVSFVWGDDLSTKETLDYFKKTLIVDGIIYDRIGEIEERRNVFLVERELKKGLFKASPSPTPSRAVSFSSFETANNNSDDSESSRTGSPPMPVLHMPSVGSLNISTNGLSVIQQSNVA
uniref:Glycerophosphocholine phosphodiesterase GPCPD1 n=1 Tax=Steinernema glaseri TaxID=37863 RepID=A0A1I7YGG9_9BILA